MSDEPKPKPPVRPTPHMANSPSDGKYSSANDVIGNTVIALCVVTAVVILVLAVVGALGS